MTRCFWAVLKNGERKDFSIGKCINAMKEYWLKKYIDEVVIG